MEEVFEILVTHRRIELLRQFTPRIRFLYDIDVVNEEVDRAFNSLITLRLRIKSNIEKNPNIVQAKEYIKSVCAVDGVERRCQYSPEIFHHLLRCRDCIERLSGAVLVFNSGDHEVVVWGQEYNVSNALFMLDQSAQQYLSQLKNVDDSLSSQRLMLSRKSSQLVSDRRKLEAVDSSYDSDCENPDTDHTDVSRTVSDTLGAEFAEYINIDTNKLVSSLCESENSAEESSEDSSASSDGQYTVRVEFALKLGYTEDQVQLALHKLGNNPGQNELLAELIRLCSTSGSNPSSSKSESIDVSAESSSAAEGSVAASQPSRSENSKSSSSQSDECDSSPSSNLRHIVVDGSNVAIGHGKKEKFSCRGIRICVDYFRQRGHQDITVFVPSWRKEMSRPDAPIIDQDILLQLEQEGILAFTPSRQIKGRRQVCYDDRYILKLASEVDGVVVSNDNYRDLINESQEYKKVVEERLLMYTFVSDRFMPPDDPLGRHGPSLDNFLKKSSKTVSDTATVQQPYGSVCPYGKKCTYGNKCKYQHPERGNMPQKSVSERLVEQSKSQIRELKSRGSKSSLRSTVSLPTMSDQRKDNSKKLLSRTKTNVTSNVPKELATQSTIPEVGGNFQPYDVHNPPGNNTWSPPLSSSPFLQTSESLQTAQQQLESAFSNEGSNFHRKLKREPSINPMYDPRIAQTLGERYASAMYVQHQDVQQQQHPLLTRSHTEWRQHFPHPNWNYDQSDASHQAVTRISSAPDSYQKQQQQQQHHHHPWSLPCQRSSMSRQASTSDSQLNLFNELSTGNVAQSGWTNPHGVVGSRNPSLPIWTDTRQQQGATHRTAPQHNACQSSQQSSNINPKLYYHLCSLFPIEQVEAIRRLYPNETNVQKLCAAIIQRFPPPQSSNE